jgi:hypothetical protein
MTFFRTAEVPMPTKEQAQKIKELMNEQKEADQIARAKLRSMQREERSAKARSIQSAVSTLRSGWDKKPTAAELRAKRKEEAFAGLAGWLHQGRTQ